MSTYRFCPWCGRTINADSLADPKAHAPGCKTRRSLLAKKRAEERKEKLLKKAARKMARELAKR